MREIQRILWFPPCLSRQLKSESNLPLLRLADVSLQARVTAREVEIRTRRCGKRGSSERRRWRAWHHRICLLICSCCAADAERDGAVSARAAAEPKLALDARQQRAQDVLLRPQDQQLASETSWLAAVWWRLHLLTCSARCWVCGMTTASGCPRLRRWRACCRRTTRRRRSQTLSPTMARYRNCRAVWGEGQCYRALRGRNLIGSRWASCARTGCLLGRDGRQLCGRTDGRRDQRQAHQSAVVREDPPRQRPGKGNRACVLLL